MFKYILRFLFLLPVLSYAQGPETILTVPWSETDGIHYSDLPEGRYGPQAFSVYDEGVYLLDNQNNRIQVYKDTKPIKVYKIPEGSFNLFVSEDHILVSNNHQIFSVQEKGYELLFSAAPKYLLKEIKQKGKTLYLIDSRNQISSLNTQQKIASLSAEQFSFSEKVNSSTGRINYTDSQETTTFDILFPENDLASIRVIGQDKSNRIYVAIERYVQHIPLEIERELKQYDKSGNLLNRIILPAKGFTRCANDLYVASDGRVYFLDTTSDGLQIIKFDLTTEVGTTIKFTPVNDFQDEDSPGLNHENESSEFRFSKIAPFPEVTPDESLQTGDSYVQLHWSCTSDNLTNGLITDSYGNLVRTPAWVTADNHQNVVYKWGGFQTIDQFVDGLISGKYAGDNYTSKGYGTPSAVGVDCSGFVSRCWNLPSHYSTRMMDDSITIAYDNWEEAKPGDAVHKEGHVRLVVENNPDGTITVVESAGYNWRVSYRTYTYAELYNYMPRYYINMQGTPGNVPQPKLATVLSNSEKVVSWSIGGTDVVSDLKLYVSEDGAIWDQSYTVDKNSLHCAWPDALEGCQFFKMTSIADADQSESLPSDVYGAYERDSEDKVLIVDGFDRTSSTSGSWNHTYHNFAVDYGMALYKLEIPFESVSNDAVLNEDVNLNDYRAVIWFNGDESTADETFSNTEQTFVENYLNQGGNLFVTGSEVAWDLDYRGSSSDQRFFNNYLKSDYLEDDSDSYTVNGTQESPFEGLVMHYDDGSHAVYEEDYPDVLKVANGSKEALHYANGKLAAVYYEGTFPNGTAPGKLFYMGFPFETIYNDKERLALMGSVMNFFEITINLVQRVQPVSIQQFELLGNYPNPFNNSTSIRYFVPAGGKMTIDVYNSLGERVINDNWSSKKGSGEYNLTVNNWPTGVYFYRLEYNKKSVQNSRFILLK